MDWQTTAGLMARHLLTTLGGVIVTRGWIDSSQLEPIIGAVMVVGGVFWSIVQKLRAAK